MLSQVLVTDYRSRWSHVLKRKWMCADFPLSRVSPRAVSNCNLSHNLRDTGSQLVSADPRSAPVNLGVSLQSFCIYNTAMQQTLSIFSENSKMRQQGDSKYFFTGRTEQKNQDPFFCFICLAGLRPHRNPIGTSDEETSCATMEETFPTADTKRL